MTRTERRSLIAIPIILGIGFAIAWAGSQNGARVAGMPIFALCGGLALAINWAAFVPAYLRQTERYFDVTGSATYLAIVAVALGARGDLDLRALAIGTLVVAWAVRLGSFLFVRVQRDGGDGRFDAIKKSLPRFLMTWTLQALWVYLTIACGLAAMTTATSRPLGPIAVIGLAVWALGFAIEVTADQQKRAFRADPANRGRFIRSGIWAWSRHPNYFGEILLWLGVAIVALPVLRGWQLATLVSPLFVYVLLTRISGIPLLAARAWKRWGGDPEYRAYLARTPALFPRPPRAS
jgi:steroid 5-alpha reductase family enzyme